MTDRSILAAVLAASQPHAETNPSPAPVETAPAPAPAASAPAPVAAAAPAPAPVAGVPADERKAIATAERGRIASILSCEAAKGRETFANHLAFKTEMSAEEALGFLEASPLAAAAAAPAAPAKPLSPLAAAMAGAGLAHPVPAASPAPVAPVAASIDLGAIYQSRAGK